MKRIPGLLQFAVLLTVVLLFGCCNKCPPNDPFCQAGFDIWDAGLNKRVEAYYDAGQMISATKTPESHKVYIDFSNGLVQAYTGNSQNARILEHITQRLTGENIRWFGLGGGKIYPLEFSTTQLFNRVTDPKSYSSEIMAPIEETVRQITASAGDALFVTDFEEYTTDRREQFENFARDYFIEWLRQGNSIDFFVTDYQERANLGRTVGKHLYFIVFNYGPSKKLLADVEYALKDRGYSYRTFSLSTDFYKLKNDYGAVKKGGNYYDQKGNDIVGYINEDQYVNGLNLTGKEKVFEFYPFQLTWEDIYKNATSLMEPGVPVPFTDFFRKLFLDASKDDVFQLKGLEIKVYDVTQDFELYSKTQEIPNHKPKLTKDANGFSIFDPAEVDPIALTCYDSLGNVKESWMYKPVEKSLINEMFILNSDLYDNGFKNTKDKIELGTKFHSNYNGPQLINPSGLLRVDIIISECDPNFEKLGMFRWESTTVMNRTNESLAEAIRNTLNRVNPEGKIIYSYFIKTGDKICK